MEEEQSKVKRRKEEHGNEGGGGGGGQGRVKEDKADGRGRRGRKEGGGGRRGRLPVGWSAWIGFVSAWVTSPAEG